MSKISYQVFLTLSFDNRLRPSPHVVQICCWGYLSIWRDRLPQSNHSTTQRHLIPSMMMSSRLYYDWQFIFNVSSFTTVYSCSLLLLLRSESVVSFSLFYQQVRPPHNTPYYVRKIEAYWLFFFFMCRLSLYKSYCDSYANHYNHLISPINQFGVLFLPRECSVHVANLIVCFAFIHYPLGFKYPFLCNLSLRVYKVWRRSWSAFLILFQLQDSEFVFFNEIGYPIDSIKLCTTIL